MNDYMTKFKETENFIREKVNEIPKIAIVLGSGLGNLSDEIKDKIVIPYKDIPNFPRTEVAGHKGELVFGKLDGVNVVLMSGRFSYYEGHDMKEITFPFRVFALLGIKSLFLSNAAGAINTNFKKGDLMIINDHLSFFLDNPLRGKNMDEFGDRFIDMSDAYDKEYRAILRDITQKEMGHVNEGVYAYMNGPTYETPAEIRALRTLGADVVGMSTVPEVIVAHHSGIRVAGVSCITNMAAGVEDVILSHEDVLKTANELEEHFKKIVIEFIKKID